MHVKPKGFFLTWVIGPILHSSNQVHFLCPLHCGGCMWWSWNSIWLLNDPLSCHVALRNRRYDRKETDILWESDWRVLSLAIGENPGDTDHWKALSGSCGHDGLSLFKLYLMDFPPSREWENLPCAGEESSDCILELTVTLFDDIN